MSYQLALPQRSHAGIINLGFQMPQTELLPRATLIVAICRIPEGAELRLNFFQAHIVNAYPLDAPALLSAGNAPVFAGIWSIPQGDSVESLEGEPERAINFDASHVAEYDPTLASIFYAGTVALAIVNNTSNVAYSVTACGAPTMYTGAAA